MLPCAPKLLRLCLVGLTWSIGVLSAEEPPSASPFLPPTDSAEPAAPDSSSGYEFVGVTATAAQTLVSIRRLSDQRSVWIPVGRTLAEITVVSYDSTKDEVVLRTANAPLTLRLRDHGASAATASAPNAPRLLPAPAAASPTPAPVAVPGKPLSVQEEKELEARMLVTDLLEIGQQQRKAYEEARRRDADTKATPAPTAPGPQPPPKPVAPASRSGEHH
jgi:hypothetical protein